MGVAPAGCMSELELEAEKHAWLVTLETRS